MKKKEIICKMKKSFVMQDVSLYIKILTRKSVKLYLTVTERGLDPVCLIHFFEDQNCRMKFVY